MLVFSCSFSSLYVHVCGCTCASECVSSLCMFIWVFKDLDVSVYVCERRVKISPSLHSGRSISHSPHTHTLALTAAVRQCANMSNFTPASWVQNKRTNTDQEWSGWADRCTFKFNLGYGKKIKNTIASLVSHLTNRCAGYAPMISAILVRKTQLLRWL